MADHVPRQRSGNLYLLALCFLNAILANESQPAAMRSFDFLSGARLAYGDHFYIVTRSPGRMGRLLDTIA
jgi:hypothetical protein